MKQPNFGVEMKTPLYLFSLIALAGSALANSEDSFDEESVAQSEEVAVIKRRAKGLDVASHHAGRIETLEQQMDEVYTDTVRDTFGARAASARPQLNSIGLYFSGDAIYWKAFEGGTDYVAAPNSSKRFDFNWSWGLKLEMGYHLDHDGWDLAGHYTWFHDKATRHDGNPGDDNLTPLFPTYYTNTASTARGVWNLNVNDADLGLQKSYFLSRQFALTPIAALRTTWINQAVNATYTSPTETTVTGKNDFWGIGPKAGLGTRLYINRNWNFFAQAAGSLLYSEFDVLATTITSGSTTVLLKGDLHRIVPAIQAGLGFGWEMNFCDDGYHIAANVSYETQYWWRQNELFSYINPSAPLVKRLGEDLGLHGLTMNLLFDF